MSIARMQVWKNRKLRFKLRTIAAIAMACVLASNLGPLEAKASGTVISCPGGGSFTVSDNGAGEVYARLKHAVIERSDETILLADHTKVGVASSYFFARPADLDLWITDQELAPQVAEAVTAQGLRVEVAGKDAPV